MEVEGETYYYEYPYYEDLDDTGKATPTTAQPVETDGVAGEVIETTEVKGLGEGGTVCQGEADQWVCVGRAEGKVGRSL